MSKKRPRPERTAFEEPSEVEKIVRSAQAKLEDEARYDRRGVAGSAGIKGVDKRGVSKATYNLPLNRQSMVNEVAGKLDVPKNDLVEAAIVALYNAIQNDPTFIDNLIRPGRLLTNAYRLDVPDDFDPYSKS